jgi:hypothetical protein
MINNTRRNKNIGTAKQGHGQNNKLTIAEPYSTSKYFYERLNEYTKTKKIINGHEFVFIIEKARDNSIHSCSIEDVQTIIEQIPESDYGDLKFIIFRQPKRKEEILSPVWGRLIYIYEFENEYFPAIIIDAINLNKKLKWSNKLSLEKQKELERLKDDGHDIINDGKYYIAEFKKEASRSTQLYRTLLHEFGHYVHYLEFVERPSLNNQDYEERRNLYFKIPTIEKEKFANTYAEKLYSNLKSRNIIPF